MTILQQPTWKGPGKGGPKKGGPKKGGPKKGGPKKGKPKNGTSKNGIGNQAKVASVTTATTSDSTDTSLLSNGGQTLTVNSERCGNVVITGQDGFQWSSAEVGG